jgi:hypothetical protein
VASVAVEGDGVDDEGVAEQVEVLAGVAEGVGSPEVEGVVEVAVDALGVVAPGVEPLEVGVGRGDGSEVLGAVELAGGVVVVAVEPHGEGAAAVAVGELVVVVPAVAAVLVGVAVGALAAQLDEGEVAGVVPGCMLICMQSTSVRIDVSTHEELKRLASELHTTVGNAVALAVRALRQDQVGAELAQPLRDDEALWLDADLG